MSEGTLENKQLELEDDKSLLGGYKVKLEAFEGPFDLLLSMIDKGDLDLYNISLATITAGFIDYIKAMEKMNIVIGGEFLLMAAYLLERKSKMLLPQQTMVKDEELMDVEQDLLQRLAEYKIYKHLAEDLRARKEVFQRVYTRYAPEEALADQEIFLVDVSMKDLVNAFQRVWALAEKKEQTQEINPEQITVEEKITEMEEKLANNPNGLIFDKLFTYFSKLEIIVTFLAILELMKRKAIKIMQNETYGEIMIFSSGGNI